MLTDKAGNASQIGRWGVTNPISTSASSANLQLQPNKVYRLQSDNGVYIKFGVDNTVVASSADSAPLAAGVVAHVRTNDTAIWIAGILITGTGPGTLSVTEVLLD